MEFESVFLSNLTCFRILKKRLSHYYLIPNDPINVYHIEIEQKQRKRDNEWVGNAIPMY